jgi:OOP family OmpA-OmpF porin
LKRVAAAATLLALFAAPVAAHAQSSLGGYALEQLDPAPAGDDFFGVRSPHAVGHLVPRGHLMFDLANDPLVIAGGSAAIVSQQAFLRADVSLSLFDRLLLSLDVPVAVLQSGDAPTFDGVAITSPDGAAMGDLRFDLRARVAGEDRGPLQLGLGMSLYLPTAGEDTYAGDGAVRGHPHGTLGGRIDGDVAFVWSATGGLVLRTSGNPSSIAYGAAAGVTFLEDLLQVGPELYGQTLLGDDSPLSTPAIEVAAPSTGIEVLGGAKLRVLEGLVFGFAAGGGVADAIGVPTSRVVIMAGWAPTAPRPVDPDSDADGDSVRYADDACPDTAGFPTEEKETNGCPPPDRDGDGVADPIDACPGKRGRRNADATRNGCPADYDRDGVADAEDACPNQAGIASVDEARNGCPGETDADGDGIADRADACPKAKGTRSADPAQNGCPAADGDGDGIADADDACPSERGLTDADRSRHGCPRDVRVTTGEIVILKQVRFRFGQASLDQTIDPVSDDLLTEVRDVMQQRQDIQVIEVQGHADDVGAEAINTTISQRRADAVRTWLVQKGIDPKRLVARGYGSKVPLGSNTTEEGRQKNRRVQFVIVRAK